MSASGFYRMVWRWHFYAGLFCIPFVLWLALTGAAYVWRPQGEAWLDRRIDAQVAPGRPAPLDTQAAAARAALPGATLAKFILPERPGGATRWLLTRGGETWRVTLDPVRCVPLQRVREEKRPFRLLFHLHGELLAGPAGSYLVELAACWTIVMLLTGLFLWWPRGRGLAGLVYPRLTLRGRPLWRDLHASAGLWLSLLALGLIVTGLPWAQGWGSYLRTLRHLAGARQGPVDWTIGGRAPAAAAGASDHAGHDAMAGMDGMGAAAGAAPAIRPGELARAVAVARRLALAGPVTIQPPARPGGPWTIASDAADRPRRASAELDAATGRVTGVHVFADRPALDRAIGYGVAAHEGALFGLANQLLSTVTALGLMLLAGSGALLWWKRRPIGLLGAPVPAEPPRLGPGLVAGIALLGVALPVFGASLILLLLVERLALRRIAPAARWLGLRTGLDAG